MAILRCFTEDDVPVRKRITGPIAITHLARDFGSITGLLCQQENKNIRAKQTRSDGWKNLFSRCFEYQTFSDAYPENQI